MPELLDLYATLLDFTCQYTSDSVCAYTFLLALLPQIVENPTLHQNCGHTYEIGACFIISGHFLLQEGFFFQENLCQRNAAEKNGRKKIKIRNPQKHLCPTVMYHIRQALYNCYTDVAPRLHVMHCTYEHPISAQNPKYM